VPLELGAERKGVASGSRWSNCHDGQLSQIVSQDGAATFEFALIRGESMHRGELIRHWRTLAGCTVAASVGNMGLYLYTVGAFVPALIADAGYTKEQLSLGSLFLAGTVAICAPVAGLLMDRFGALRIVSFSIVGEVVALALLGLSPTQFPIYVACLMLLGVLGIGTAPPGFSRMITSCFDQARGLALGITICGLGVVGIVGPIGATWLIEHIGWRYSYFALACLVSLLGAIGILLIRSDDGSAEESIDTPSRVPIKERNLLGRPLFWIMLGGFFAPALFGNGYLLHLIVLLRERGFSSATAAQVQAMIGIAVLLGRLGSGTALDRFPAPRVGAITFGISAFGCALLLRSDPFSVRVAAFAIGVTIGAEIDILAYFVSRYFGLAKFGRLYGLAYSGVLVAAGASPILIGYFERVGGYPMALIASTIGTLVGAVVVFFLPDPRRVEMDGIPARLEVDFIAGAL
jgi:MFS family permease